MHNLKVLFKNNFNILLGRLSGKKKRKSTAAATALLVLGCIGIFALYTLQAYSMFNGLGKLHLEKVCVFHAILTTLAVIVIIGIMRTSANQKSNDSDFLLSLPIKKSEIIFSKTINKYLFDLFFSFVLFMPYLILYLIFAGFNTSLFVLGTIFVFLLPLLSVGISYICDFVVSRLFNKFRLGGLFKSFAIIFVFSLVMILMLLKTFTYGQANFASLDAYFADRPISNFVLSYLFSPNILNISVVLLCLLLPFVLGIVLYSLNFGKTFAAYSSNNKNLKFNSGKSSLKNLYRKELYNYANTPAYIINTIIGAIMVLVVSIYLCTLGIDGINRYLGTNFDPTLIAGLISVLLCALTATAPISASSISLEGKNIWLLKSSPINEKELLLSKILVHISILQPCIFLAFALLTGFLKLTFLQAIIILILPTLSNLILSVVGLFFNLWLPVLEFDNETKVVKQSLSVLLTMMFGILLALIPFGLYMLSNLSIATIFAITCAIYLAILITFSALLFTIGIKMFRKL